MKRILLYSPDVIGHPRVYCRVIADSLAGSDCELVLAIGFGPMAELADCADLLPLIGRKGVKIVDTRDFSESRAANLTAEEITDLQRTLEIDTTLFIEGDKSETEFRRMAAGIAPHLHARNLAIFANTAEWYPGEDSFTGMSRGIIAPTLRTTLGNIKRAVLEKKNSPRHFYEDVLLRSRVLDEILVKDERLADWHGEPVYWMPEISRPVATPESAAEAAEYLRRKIELAEFLSANRGREPMLYFGDAAFYKGYDLFLEFVRSTPSACAIHAGRSYDIAERGRFQFDIDSIRQGLKQEGRLFETNGYVHAQRLKELFFGSIRVYITTHRLMLSSSTVIQALEMGIPVLVPNRGLLGHRVRVNNLGEVYEYGDLEDLSTKADSMWRSDLCGYSASIEAFWKRFSDGAIRKFFEQRLIGTSIRSNEV